jgi:hypothetical protein
MGDELALMQQLKELYAAAQVLGVCMSALNFDMQQQQQQQ